MGNTKTYIVRGGECGERIREIDWSGTELGPLEDWSQELLSIVNTILNSPLAFVLICNQGGYLIYNDAYARFAGPKHPEILGQNYAEAWPEVADYNRDMFARINTGETISYNEQLLQLKRHDKLEDVYLDLNYSPIFNTDDGTIAILVSVIDVTSSVTAREKVKTALLEARTQKRLAENASLINRTITENATTALFIMNSSFKCTFMNPAAETMVGYSFEEIQKQTRTLHELIHSTHPDGSQYDSRDCPIIGAMERHDEASGKETFVRRDGSYFPVFFAVSPIVKNEKLSSVILEVRDITDNEELVELNRAKNDFIAMASHQLRTPATSVKQYLGVIMNGYAGPVNDDQRKYLQTAYNANDRQLVIIEGLLRTAQLDTKGLKLKLRLQSLTKAVHESAKKSHDIFEAKNQELEIKLPVADVTARFDKAELVTCIDNLLENASKYSGKGAAVKLSIRKRPDSVDINVQDYGVGIAPNDQEVVFEKFTRVDNALSNTVSGNGLGLYWVKRVIDLHKGKIIIKSGIGVGTTFTIRLPL